MNQNEIIQTTSEADHLRKRIMHKVYTRWFFAKKLPQLMVEFGVIAFLVMASRPRIFFSAVFDNALHSSSGPVSFARYFLMAYANTTPGVKLLFAVVAVVGIFVARDIYSTRRYASSIKA